MSFSTESFTFAIVPFGAASQAAGSMDLPHRHEWYIDAELFESGKLPQLNSAPEASWFLARLRALDESVPAETEEHADGGGYSFEMAVASGTSVVATMQVQGGMEGVVAIGRAINDQTCEHIMKELVEAMTESPEQLSECCYRVVDPEWTMDPDYFVPRPNENSQNEYGWRDGLLLGIHNIRETSSVN